MNVFINTGADVNVETQNGMTSLQIAVMKGHAEMMKALIDAGADVSVTGSNGFAVNQTQQGWILGVASVVHAGPH